MNAREKELLARHCLLHLNEVVAIWHRKEWRKLAAVVEYAQAGIPAALSKTDPYLYRQLCAGLCECHIYGFDCFNLECILALAEAAEKDMPPPLVGFGGEVMRHLV